uniref:RING-type E3 ubiquitin transferase n=1 Tax=Brassica oleracea TaxID=3712 RepID=Q2A9U3_BRAOL|nr:zinc finger, C3HC4 type (RING finger) containing protein [Brassica oleracea]
MWMMISQEGQRSNPIIYHNNIHLLCEVDQKREKASVIVLKIQTKHPNPESFKTSLEPSPPLSPHSLCIRWKPYSNSSEFQANASVLLILFVSALICGLSLCAAIRCFLRPNLQTDDNEHKPDPEEDVSSTVPTPTLVYSSDLELAGAQAECAICLSEFEPGESIHVLEKCHHGFHIKCIHKWLSSRSSCPTCRTSIFSQNTLDSATSAVAPSTNEINA